MTKENKPEMRFSGFNKDWKQSKVTELGNIFIGLVTTMTSHYTNEGTLLIRNSDIKDGYFEFDCNQIYLDHEFANQNKTRQHKVGDVITVHTGDIGTSAVITEKEEGSLGFATIVTRPNNKLISSEYLCTYLNTEKHKKFAMNISTGDGRNNYNLKDYYKCIVPLPCLTEQSKISSFFLKLNETITLQQRKLEILKNQKKAFLEKIFPKEGENVPEIRFSGFSDAWKQRKLSEVSDIVGGGTPNTNDESLWNGNINWFTPAEIGDEIFVSESKRKISDKGLNKSSARILPANKTVLFTSRAGIGKMAILSRDSTTNQGFQSIIVDDNNDPYFIFSMGPFIKNRAEKIASGSTFAEISGKLLGKLQFKFPSLNEQQIIGTFFSRLDNTITLQQRKLEILKNIKKSFLQKMFV